MVGPLPLKVCKVRIDKDLSPDFNLSCGAVWEGYRVAILPVRLRAGRNDGAFWDAACFRGVMVSPLPLKVCKVRIDKDLSLDFGLAVSKLGFVGAGESREWNWYCETMVMLRAKATDECSGAISTY